MILWYLVKKKPEREANVTFWILTKPKTYRPMQVDKGIICQGRLTMMTHGSERLKKKLEEDIRQQCRNGAFE